MLHGESKLFAPGELFQFSLSSADFFFQINLFEKFFQEYHLSVNG